MALEFAQLFRKVSEVAPVRNFFHFSNEKLEKILQRQLSTVYTKFGNLNDLKVNTIYQSRHNNTVHLLPKINQQRLLSEVLEVVNNYISSDVDLL